MKAYGLSDISDDDKGVLVVFAESAKEAKKLDNGTIDPDRYIDLRVKRLKEFDGLENLTPRELCKKQWENGWWFFQDGCPMYDKDYENEFYEWYDKLWER